MRALERIKSRQGATRLEFADVLTALILLGLLFYVAYLQFPAYRAGAPAPGQAAGEAPQP